ncbi:hypothetical protein AAEU32_07345 [Pseudoalteromonas sp. SSDWG2]|uniref:hypothetical protein n=1 Tax=Pseudoalteromonas sp. SSDWG2 TaxID=3139391 RepID=UPI003BAD6073
MRRIFVFILFTLVSCSSLAVTVEGAHKAPQEVVKYLQEIAQTAKLDSLSISSGSRSAAKQAQVMYDYYLAAGAANCKCADCSTFSVRKACALMSYDSIGDAAIEAITDGGNREKSISQMTQVILTEVAAMGEQRNQMAHVPLKGRYAVDIKPSSIADHKSFKAAVMKHKAVIKSRFYWPGKPDGPGESAYHIEFTISD